MVSVGVEQAVAVADQERDEPDASPIGISAFVYAAITSLLNLLTG